jgi:hypothetical protein
MSHAAGNQIRAIAMNTNILPPCNTSSKSSQKLQPLHCAKQHHCHIILRAYEHSKAPQSRQPFGHRAIYNARSPMTQRLVAALGAMSEPVTGAQCIAARCYGFFPATLITNKGERLGFNWHRSDPEN